MHLKVTWAAFMAVALTLRNVNIARVFRAQWRAATDLTKARPEPKSAHAIYMRALLVSLTNPKTLLFYGAFFPQFITMVHYIGTQIAILSVTFLAIAVLVDGGWALTAGHALASRGRLRNKVSGGLLIGAAAALAITRNN
jgi:threonine/homoserine/homoserine lactone efflux protein